MKRQNWIYQIRGLAIIAVVICHQQHLLHESEIIQLFSLYSVTALIFLMGVTKSISLKSHFHQSDSQMSILMYSLKAMVPTLCAYMVASFFYTYDPEVGIDLNTLLASSLSFSACVPFYFVKYYILLSLWAPLLYAAIKFILGCQLKKTKKSGLLILMYFLLWLIGYESIGRMDIFAQSYLFVYSCGLLLGEVKLEGTSLKKIYFLPAMVILVVGLISSKRFYWARVAGVYDYSGGVDVLAPKLQMNPPNISIVFYSFGVIGVAYLIFRFSENNNNRFSRMIHFIFIMLGKYSLDIFLWHMYIQKFMIQYFDTLNCRILQWILFYGAMLIIPATIRYIYTIGKQKVFDLLKV